jgi:transcriptional regulator with XRE-family HTH domain
MVRGKQLEERAAKSLYRPENQTFLATLRAIRIRANLSQSELADHLGRSQNYVTAAERGVTRLDGLQLRDWCQACGTDLMAWAAEIEAQLTPAKRPARKVVRKPK